MDYISGIPVRSIAIHVYHIILVLSRFRCLNIYDVFPLLDILYSVNCLIRFETST
jgi:hypothetical protein